MWCNGVWWGDLTDGTELFVGGHSRSAAEDCVSQQVPVGGMDPSARGGEMRVTRRGLGSVFWPGAAEAGGENPYVLAGGGGDSLPGSVKLWILTMNCRSDRRFCRKSL